MPRKAINSNYLNSTSITKSNEQSNLGNSIILFCMTILPIGMKSLGKLVKVHMDRCSLCMIIRKKRKWL